MALKRKLKFNFAFTDTAITFVLLYDILTTICLSVSILIYPNKVRALIVFLFVFLYPSCVLAQEESVEIAHNGKRYVDMRIKSLSKYNSRLQHQQNRLLKKLKKKEARYARKLRKQDSAAYEQYTKNPVSFDSINRIAKDDSAQPPRYARKNNLSVDKAKGVVSFVESKTGLPTPEMAANGEKLGSLQAALSKREYINSLMAKRGTELSSLAGKGNGPSLTGINKQLFYGKSKMKAFKEMEEEPEKAEDAALEFLQGTDGFDAQMNSASGNGSSGMAGMTGSRTEINEELQKRGYQTKQQLQTSLEAKFGAALPNVGKNAGDGLKKWQDKTADIKASAKEAKNARSKANGIQKPSFKVNPMRGLPFSKRIEKQYGWQVTRANAATNQPAITEPSAMYGFKHTPRLTYGVGASCAVGLGYGWDNIHITYQGIGLRTFVTWKWQYGISAYAGYERMYKRLPFVKEKVHATDMLPTTHSNDRYAESILVGLTKTYKLNKKYNGSIQLLYDIWWQQKGLQSPIVLRFSTIKK